MNTELSQLAARYFTVAKLTLAQRLQIIPYVEKAKTLGDIPEPWRTQMQKIKSKKDTLS